MKLVLDGFNKSIHKKDNQIIIKENKEVIFDDLAQKINNITILGKGYVTFDALTLLTKNNANIISITYDNRINYIINNIDNQTQVKTLKQQVYHSDSKKSIITAQEIIKSKIKNQMYTLKTLFKNRENDTIKENIQNIENNIEKLNQTKTKNEIRGIEGNTSQNILVINKKHYTTRIQFRKQKQKTSNRPLQCNAKLWICSTIITNYNQNTRRRTKPRHRHTTCRPKP